MSRRIVNESTRVLEGTCRVDAEPQARTVVGRGRMPIPIKMSLAWQGTLPRNLLTDPYSRLVCLPVHYARGEEIMNSRYTIWAMEQTSVEWKERLLSIRQDNSGKQQPFILRVTN